MPPGRENEVDDDIDRDARSGSVTSRISDLREIAREHAPERLYLSQIPERIAVEVVAQLAEDRAHQLSKRLSRDDQDRAIQINRAVEELQQARERDDVKARRYATERLVALVVAEATT